MYITAIGYGSIVLLGILSELAAAYSIHNGFVFDHKVITTLQKPKTGYEPRVCVLMPCKGTELNLSRNIEAVLDQEYPEFQVAIIVDSKDDPAYTIARSLTEKHAQSSSILISKGSRASGKVAALSTAIEATKGQWDVYAFVDSDSLTSKRWLRDLVDPLGDQSIGSTTGFRWYIPSRGGIWSHFQASWNASGTNLLFDDHFNFPWGGSMASRAETLEKVAIKEVWAEALSDDLSLNRVLRAHGYRILFLPQCMIVSFVEATRKQFLEWATRQTTLTRAYNHGLWRYALIAYGFFDVTFLVGLLAVGLGFLLDHSFFIPAFLLLLPQLFGALRSIQRCSTFAKAMPEFRMEINGDLLPGAAASFIVPWIMTYCIIRSAFAHEITWRGRTYKLTELKSLAPPRSFPETAHY